VHPQMLRHSTATHMLNHGATSGRSKPFWARINPQLRFTRRRRANNHDRVFSAVARVTIQNERRWHFSRVHKVSSLVRSCVPNAAIRSASAARISAGVSERHAPQSERCQQALSHRTLGCAPYGDYFPK